MNKLLMLVTLLVLTACSQTSDCACENEPMIGPSYQDQQAFEALIQYFANEVKKEWGESNYLEASKHHYVKYIDGYRTRAHIDFDKGKIYVSTVDRHRPQQSLRYAIIETLLMSSDPSKVDLFSDAKLPLSGKPFLMGQVVDHEGHTIEWQWRAQRFADYLLTHKLHRQQQAGTSVHYVEIDMVRDHLAQREYQYAHLIRAASQRYGIGEDLIYAIIKTESSFNPYAVSHAGAYGLMQVMPKTAGADVFALVKGRSGVPSRAYLFDPANNIDTGVAYFQLLKQRYLKGISHPTNLHYSMISAYNGGAGGVLSTFNRDRKRAVKDINGLQPQQLYWALTTRHPKAEARRYLQKVVKFQQAFNQGQL
ncbi:membrane-bound lytic murein transglycosylase MltC [Shewanella sp. NIFS-20-20]|uniref:membrane-bound lytic murein transglycosylase MltC n=1 Tax=Shewanella sp. NIFS-20-20 TaxID=2853806 RepID=UPI001C441D28|nr:membrane-bound lytic murein transglycosylase MltC [Shewanella sp. NIFS-20-20]MBV7314733.1 membrane-bound lytic murein transglycosylase MltC [Shewanella sp. NIFS-20-20]